MSRKDEEKLTIVVERFNKSELADSSVFSPYWFWLDFAVTKN